MCKVAEYIILTRTTSSVRASFRHVSVWGRAIGSCAQRRQYAQEAATKRQVNANICVGSIVERGPARLSVSAPASTMVQRERVAPERDHAGHAAFEATQYVTSSLRVRNINPYTDESTLLELFSQVRACAGPSALTAQQAGSLLGERKLHCSCQLVYAIPLARPLFMHVTCAHTQPTCAAGTAVIPTPRTTSVRARLASPNYSSSAGRQGALNGRLVQVSEQASGGGIL